MKPIATVHWTDPHGQALQMEFATDEDLAKFIAQLKKSNVCFYACLCGGAVTPNKASTRTVERVS